MPSARDGAVTTTDGVRISYRDHGGTGRPLILLHGGGGNLETMDPYAQRLADGHRVVALDLRGCGQSGPAQRYRWPDLVLDVEAVVRMIGRERPTFWAIRSAEWSPGSTAQCIRTVGSSTSTDSREVL